MVVIEGNHLLPEGARVIVVVESDADLEAKQAPVRFPIFHSKNPGTLELSGNRVSEILDDEEISSGHNSADCPCDRSRDMRQLEI